MKAVTEFPNFTLSRALKAKTDLLAAGKTPEEVQTSLGETFKLEGDRLKHFMNAIDIAGQNSENLKRVIVVSLNEGENAPAKAIKVEEHHYVPEFLVTAAAAPAASPRGGARGGKRRDGPKSSPWGMSPEEKAAKNAKSSAAKAKA